MSNHPRTSLAEEDDEEASDDGQHQYVINPHDGKRTSDDLDDDQHQYAINPHDGKRASLSIDGKRASLSIDGKRASLSNDGKRASLSNDGKRTSVSNDAKSASTSAKRTSASTGKKTSFVPNEPETFSVDTDFSHDEHLHHNRILEVDQEDIVEEPAKNRKKSSAGSVKFSEPLNVPEELERKYEELMGVESDLEDHPPALSVAPKPVQPKPPPRTGGNKVDESKQLVEIGAPASASVANNLSHQDSTIAEYLPLKTSSVDPSTTATGSPSPINSVNPSSVASASVNPNVLTSIESSSMTAVNPSALTTVQSSSMTAVSPTKYVNLSIMQQAGTQDAHNDKKGANPRDDPYAAYEITPEDIFNEIKVARTENKDNEHSQTLNSFIISKSFSSENVVVLLNLRRMEDGEWVLDKTIAQGLKPQTYGGVVSIDEYDFPNQNSTGGQPEKQEPSSTRSLKQMPPQNRVGDEAVTDDVKLNSKHKNMMDVLKKLEAYVAEVNREIQAAREILKRTPQCVNGNQSADISNSNELAHFDELPFIDKLIKMFNVITADEDEPCCNLCNNVQTSGHGQSAISYWLRALMLEVSNFCPAMLLPKEIMDITASSTMLVSQSQAILEEVKKSGLLNKLSNNGLLASNHVLDNVKTAAMLNPKQQFGSSPNSSESITGLITPRTSPTETESQRQMLPAESPSKSQVTAINAVPIKEDGINLPSDSSMGGSLQINIESKADDIDKFVKEHQ